MAYATRVQFDAVRQLAFGSLSAIFTPIGSPTSTNARIIRIVNTTNVDIYISVDGTTNNLRLAPSSFILIDFSTNRIQDDGLFLMAGTQFYAATISGSASSGSVWVEILSGSGGN